MNDNELRPVTIIVGRVWKRKGGKPLGVHVILVAPDDDSAVRRHSNSLARKDTRKLNLTRSAKWKANRTTNRSCRPTKVRWKERFRSSHST